MRKEKSFAVLVGAVTLLVPAILFAHEGGGDETSFIGQFIDWLGQFHVAIVHFPIALIVAAALAEFLGLVTKRDFFFDAARFTVVIAALSAIPTVMLGFAAEHAAGGFDGAYAEIFERHEGFAVTTMIITVVAAVASELGRRKQIPKLIILYRIAIFAAMVTVTITGHFGGELVHGVGYWKW